MRRLQRRISVIGAAGPSGYLKAAARRLGRSRRAVSRPADRRDELLPRRRRLRGAGHPGHPETVRGRAATEAVRIWVPALLDRRGGLLPRHPPARAHARPWRIRRACRSSPPTSTSASLTVARTGRYPEAYLSGLARADRAALRHRGRQCGDREGRARPVHLRPAQRPARPAVLAPRSRLLPQPADLPRRRSPAAADAGAALRAATTRLPVHRDGGERDALRGPVRDDRQAAPHLPGPRCDPAGAFTGHVRARHADLRERWPAAPTNATTHAALRHAVEAQMLSEFTPAARRRDADGRGRALLVADR